MDPLRLRRIIPLLALCGLFAAVAPRPAAADPIVYVAGGGNEFGTLSLSTGAFTQIGTLRLPTNDLIFGMGFGADGSLYGVDSQANAQLFRINPLTAAVANLGGLGRSAIDVTSDAAGRFYALSQDANATAYRFNAPATTTTLIGSTGITSTGLAAVNAAGTQLFTSVAAANGDNLVLIDTITGRSTTLGPIGFAVDNGLFVNNVLYGFDYGMDAIITINTTTGVGTRVATYSLPGGDTILASATPTPFTPSVPEPSSLVLVAIAGGAGVACAARRRPAVA